MLHEVEEARRKADASVREARARQTEAAEAVRRSEWLIEQRRAAPAQGPLAVRKAELEGELASERRQSERLLREDEQRRARIAVLRAQLASPTTAGPCAERLGGGSPGERHRGRARQRISALEAELAADRLAGEEMAGELRTCAAQEAEIQAALRTAGETVTDAEVAAQRLRDQAGEAELELRERRRAPGTFREGQQATQTAQRDASPSAWTRSRSPRCAREFSD